LGLKKFVTITSIVLAITVVRYNKLILYSMPFLFLPTFQPHRIANKLLRVSQKSKRKKYEMRFIGVQQNKAMLCSLAVKLYSISRNSISISRNFS